ncbi:MAG: hypothetical protein ACJAUP_002163 [Cellvibrionaceae bacterium]|jgi:hypothetical protein
MSHYENRYSSKCIFCLKDKKDKEISEITKEHFFGKTVATKITTEGNTINYGLKGGSPISDFTLKAVCKVCNNHVLGEKIMGPVTDTIIDIFSGKIDYIPKSKTSLVNKYFMRMGILVDIATGNYGLSEDKVELISKRTHSNLTKYKPLLPDDDRFEFIKNLDASKVFVQLASCTGEDGQFGAADIRSACVMDRSSDDFAMEPALKEFVMVYHKLAFIITIGGDRRSGSYLDFKLISNFCYRNKLILPKIDQTSLLSYYQPIFSGPCRGRVLSGIV